jgi:hypothetical protein
VAAAAALGLVAAVWGAPRVVPGRPPRQMVVEERVLVPAAAPADSGSPAGMR